MVEKNDMKQKKVDWGKNKKLKFMAAQCFLIFKYQPQSEVASPFPRQLAGTTEERPLVENTLQFRN